MSLMNPKKIAIKLTLKRPEWPARVSMDHLLHTSQKINTFSDVSERSRLLLFAHPLALGPWGEPGIGERVIRGRGPVSPSDDPSPTPGSPQGPSANG